MSDVVAVSTLCNELFFHHLCTFCALKDLATLSEANVFAYKIMNGRKPNTNNFNATPTSKYLTEWIFLRHFGLNSIKALEIDVSKITYGQTYSMYFEPNFIYLHKYTKTKVIEYYDNNKLYDFSYIGKCGSFQLVLFWFQQVMLYIFNILIIT